MGTAGASRTYGSSCNGTTRSSPNYGNRRVADYLKDGKLNRRPTNGLCKWGGASARTVSTTSGGLSGPAIATRDESTINAHRLQHCKGATYRNGRYLPK